MSVKHAEHQTIGAALNGKRNAFGALRLGFAILVIVSHAFPLGNGVTDPVKALFTNGQVHMGTFAVIGFLGISGYVVTKSAMRIDVMQFFWHRVLRIFPAFWVTLAVVALVFGPLAWSYAGNDLADYFTFGANGPFAYLAANWQLTINQWGILDVWANDTPYGESIGKSAVNGSLWTLSYEWLCYLIVGAVGAAGILTKARILIPITAGLLTVASVMNLAEHQSATHMVPGLGDTYRVQLLLIFFLGATAAVYSDKILFSDGFGIASLVILAFALHWGGFFVIGLPAMVYSMIYLAVRLPQWAKRIGQEDDYSYAVYLYAWPVQMMTAQLGWTEWGLLPWTAACIAATFALAWLSWNFIEKPVMRMKGFGPGRGIRYWVDKVKPAKPNTLVSDDSELAPSSSGS